MGFSYHKLWVRLLERNMTRTELREAIGMTKPTLAAMGRNEYISMRNLEKICEYLECDIGDILEYRPRGKEDNDESSN